MDGQQLERDNKRFNVIKRAAKAVAKKKTERFTERRRELEYKRYLKSKGVEL